MGTIITTIIATSGAAFVNFIFTKIYNLITKSRRNFFWQQKGFDLKALRSPFDFAEIKKRTRIVVVDDEQGFPLKLFQAEGYAIEHWDKVTAENYSKLESGFYDIIILDIQGVAKEISNEDGLGVLETIKKKNPSQIIIAFSQHSYDLNKTKFFVQADEYIAKPSDFLKIRSSIDNLITTKYNPERYIQSLHQLLRNNGVKQETIDKIDLIIYDSVKKKNKPEFKNILDFPKSNGELLGQILSLTNTILKFFQ